jgi:hypothetical protein
MIYVIHLINKTKIFSTNMFLVEMAIYHAALYAAVYVDFQYLMFVDFSKYFIYC